MNPRYKNGLISEPVKSLDPKIDSKNCFHPEETSPPAHCNPSE